MSEAAVPVVAQPWRIAITTLVFVALCTVVVLRLYHLQVKNSEHLTERGVAQRLRKLEIQAARGNLYDASGTPLAVSDGRWTLYADPGYMDDRLRATVELSRILGIPRDELRKQFESRFNGRKIAKGLDDEQAETVRALIKPAKGSGQSPIAGMALHRESMRTYPEGSLAAHVLGFVLNDGDGGAGIEQQLNAQLRGTPGEETIAVDALGAPSVIDHESRPARPGAHAQLTIDVLIQRKLEEAMGEAVARHKPTGIAGIVIRPLTGEVVAMASWPTFDPRQLAQLTDAAKRNNVLQFPYEPGSTIKPLLTGAAVAENLARWDERVFCENGIYRVAGRSKPVKDHSWKQGGHQYLTLVEGIALSDNVLAVKIAQRLGTARLSDWVRRCGFGLQSGISLPGEDRGLVHAPARWTESGSIPSVAQGYELMVTPLQMALAHAAIANRGTWLPPRLVKRVWQNDANGAEVELALPVLPPPRRIYRDHDALQIQEAMTHTMTEGTAKKSSLVGYSAAGKTGTAVKVINGRYDDDHHVGSFVCWAPASAQRAPELLALVVVDDPRENGYYGGETAAPVVQKVLQFGLEHLRVIQDQPVLDVAKAEGRVR